MDVTFFYLVTCIIVFNVVFGYEKGSIIGKRCTYQYTKRVFEFTSPGYPDFYPNNATCGWKIIAKQGWQIHLTIIDLNLEDSKHCTFDSVTVYDGVDDKAIPLLKLCGTPLPESLRSNSNTVTIIMKTDESGNGRGFNIKYKMFPGCREQFTAAKGTIISPGYPLGYPNGMFCTFDISGVSGKAIRITVEDFELEEKQYYECFDHMSIFTVSKLQEERLVGQFCGNAISKNSFCLRDVSVRIRFVTDDAIYFRGFQLNYEITDDPCKEERTTEIETLPSIVYIKNIEIFNALLDEELSVMNLNEQLTGSEDVNQIDERQTISEEITQPDATIAKDEDNETRLMIVSSAVIATRFDFSSVRNVKLDAASVNYNSFKSSNGNSDRTFIYQDSIKTNILKKLNFMSSQVQSTTESVSGQRESFSVSSSPSITTTNINIFADSSTTYYGSAMSEGTVKTFSDWSIKYSKSFKGHYSKPTSFINRSFSTELEMVTRESNFRKSFSSKLLMKNTSPTTSWGFRGSTIISKELHRSLSSKPYSTYKPNLSTSFSVATINDKKTHPIQRPTTQVYTEVSLTRHMSNVITTEKVKPVTSIQWNSFHLSSISPSKINSQTAINQYFSKATLHMGPSVQYGANVQKSIFRPSLVSRKGSTFYFNIRPTSTRRNLFSTIVSDLSPNSTIFRTSKSVYVPLSHHTAAVTSPLNNTSAVSITFGSGVKTSYQSSSFQTTQTMQFHTKITSITTVPSLKTTVVRKVTVKSHEQSGPGIDATSYQFSVDSSSSKLFISMPSISPTKSLPDYRKISATLMKKEQLKEADITDCKRYLSIEVVEGSVPLAYLTPAEASKLEEIVLTRIDSVWEVGWAHHNTSKHRQEMHYGTLIKTDEHNWLFYVRGRIRKHLHLLQITPTELASNGVQTLRELNTKRLSSTIKEFLANMATSVRMMIKYCR